MYCGARLPVCPDAGSDEGKTEVARYGAHPGKCAGSYIRQSY